MAGILNSLGFNFLVFVGQIVLFVALLVVMNAIYWKPMLAHLAGRDQQIVDAYQAVEDIRHEMERLRSDYLARITEVEAEARGHIQEAIKEAQAERERLLADARAQADATLKQGIARMEQEKMDTLASLTAGMISLAVSASQRALGASANRSAVQKTVETSVAESSALILNAARN